MNNLIADIVWQFDEKLRKGEAVRWEDYLTKAQHEAERARLVRELLCCEAYYQQWASKWVESKFKAYPEVFSSAATTCETLRLLYDNMIEVGKSPCWSWFAPFGIDPTDLALRYADDPWALGDTILGRYRLEERVGAGTFGVVFRAFDLDRQRPLAVKAPRGKDKTQRAQAEALLREEANLLASIPGAGVPRYYGLSEYGQTQFLLMEFISGLPLFEYAKKTCPQAEQAAEIIAKVASVIDRFHARGYLHRDLKPENIIVRSDGEVCIVDFGVGLREDTQFSGTATAAGTREYMAPEQILGFITQLDGRTDIWSLGAILYELLAGERFIQAENKEEAFVASVLLGQENAALARELDPGLEAIVKRCTAREPSKRFGKGADLATALRKWVERNHAASKPEADLARLRAWQLGTKLAAVLSASQMYRASVFACKEHLQSREDRSNETQKKTWSAIGHAHTLFVALDEARSLLEGIGIELPRLEEEEKYRLLFYRRKRGVAEPSMDELYRDRKELETTVKELLGQLEERLGAAGEGCLSLFRLRLSSKLHGGQESGGLDFEALAKKAALPEDVWRDVFDRLAAGLDSEVAAREVDRLDKRVERYLLHGEQGAQSGE